MKFSPHCSFVRDNSFTCINHEDGILCIIPALLFVFSDRENKFKCRGCCIACLMSGIRQCRHSGHFPNGAALFARYSLCSRVLRNRAAVSDTHSHLLNGVNPASHRHARRPPIRTGRRTRHLDPTPEQSALALSNVQEKSLACCATLNRMGVVCAAFLAGLPLATSCGSSAPAIVATHLYSRLPHGTSTAIPSGPSFGSSVFPISPTMTST